MFGKIRFKKFPEILCSFIERELSYGWSPGNAVQFVGTAALQSTSAFRRMKMKSQKSIGCLNFLSKIFFSDKMDGLKALII